MSSEAQQPTFSTPIAGPGPRPNAVPAISGDEATLDSSGRSDSDGVIQIDFSSIANGAGQTPAAPLKSFAHTTDSSEKKASRRAAPTVSPRLCDGKAPAKVTSGTLNKIALVVDRSKRAKTGDSAPPKRVSPARRAKSKFPSQVGAIVSVASRTWPGINKPGGMARITRINEEDGTCNVSYILGGHEKGVEAKWITDPKFASETMREPKKRDFYGEFVQDPFSSSKKTKGETSSSSFSSSKKSKGEKSSCAKRKETDKAEKRKRVDETAPRSGATSSRRTSKKRKGALSSKGKDVTLTQIADPVKAQSARGKVSATTKAKSSAKRKQDAKLNAKVKAKCKSKVSHRGAAADSASGKAARTHNPEMATLLLVEKRFFPEVDYSRNLHEMEMRAEPRRRSTDPQQRMLPLSIASNNLPQPLEPILKSSSRKTQILTAQSNERRKLEWSFQVAVDRLNDAFISEQSKCDAISRSKKTIAIAPAHFKKRSLCTPFEAACRAMVPSWRPVDEEPHQTTTAESVRNSSLRSRFEVLKTDEIVRQRMHADALYAKQLLQLRTLLRDSPNMSLPRARLPANYLV